MNWDDLDIQAELHLGEDSSRQFKERIESAAKLAEEMCAFSNSRGGVIYLGVKDDHSITGLTKDDLHKYNQLVSNAANENVKPAIYPQTKTAEIDGRMIMLILISEGTSKAYCTSAGVYWVKSGSDKRKASPQELMRMFQQSNLLYLDETATSANVAENDTNDGVNLAKFFLFYERSRGIEFTKTGISIAKAFQSMNLATGDKLTLAGLLLFGNEPQSFKPFCVIRAVNYPGTAISDDTFIDRRDCSGTLDDQFRGAMNFLKNNLLFAPKGGSFNQQGALEIDERALEEAVVNALLHRDYSKNAVVRLFIFSDRVEIVSPGSLPNHLTVENIINGNSVIRNPTIVSHAIRVLPYSGIGSGIQRILKNHPETSFVNDNDGEQFTTVFQRIARR